MIFLFSASAKKKTTKKDVYEKLKIKTLNRKERGHEQPLVFFRLESFGPNVPQKRGFERDIREKD